MQKLYILNDLSANSQKLIDGQCSEDTEVFEMH